MADATIPHAHEPFPSARSPGALLGPAFQELVQQNPLPEPLKMQVLETHLGQQGFGSLVHQLGLRRPTAGQARPLTPEETFYQGILERLVREDASDEVAQLQHVAGHRFTAWADLAAFAAQARVLLLSGRAS